MKPSNNRIWIIVGAATIILVILGIGLLVNRGSSPTSTGPVEVSPTDLTDTVIIDNTDKLSAILLPEQYAAASDNISSYIHNQIDKKIDHATITSDPKVLPDGVVTFKITTDKPTIQQFTVNIDRKIFDSIIVSVPETGYSQTIKVYGQSQD